MPKRGVVKFGKRKKLSPRFIGPFEILERVECTLHMHVSDVIVQNFETKFLLRRGDCKTRENPIFSKMAKS